MLHDHLNLAKIKYYNPRFTNEETDVQRGENDFSKVTQKFVAGLGTESSCCDSEACGFSYKTMVYLLSFLVKFTRL